MDQISQKEIEYLRKNNNTGIEFEYAVFYLLNPEKLRKEFLDLVVNHHQRKSKILNVISGIEIQLINERLRAENWTNCTIKIATQVDSIGPADIVLQNPDKRLLGLSIKYSNNCTLNVSSRHFLTEDSINLLKNALHNSCQAYITEMMTTYGETSNWFRRRKLSHETNKFIDLVRDKVISDWHEKSIEEKRGLLSKLTHTDSPIDFWVVKIINTIKGYTVDLNTQPIKLSNTEKVELRKEQTSYIGFYSNNVLFAKMQVKFNNGILEKSHNYKFDFRIDGISVKMGDPFGSWNFSV